VAEFGPQTPFDEGTQRLMKSGGPLLGRHNQFIWEIGLWSSCGKADADIYGMSPCEAAHRAGLETPWSAAALAHRA